MNECHAGCFAYEQKMLLIDGEVGGYAIDK